MNWRDLTLELDNWQASGRCATWWWRDDDTSRPNETLERLLGIGRRARVPVTLAVIPGRATPALGPLVSDAALQVLQHGCRHLNRAPVGAKKCELIANAKIERALSDGLGKLQRLFGQFSLPILVPPWNRVDPALVPRLAELGYTGLSTFKPRPAPMVAGLRQVNTHVDIIDWRADGGFCGADRALTAAVSHLRARRLGAADPDEPTGLLTHHLYHDEGCWRFVERLLAATVEHAAVRWLNAEQIFGARPDA